MSYRILDWHSFFEYVKKLLHHVLLIILHKNSDFILLFSTIKILCYCFSLLQKFSFIQPTLSTFIMICYAKVIFSCFWILSFIEVLDLEFHWRKSSFFFTSITNMFKIKIYILGFLKLPCHSLMSYLLFLEFLFLLCFTWDWVVMSSSLLSLLKFFFPSMSHLLLIHSYKFLISHILVFIFNNSILVFP